MTQVTEQELIEKAKAPRVTELSLLDNIKAQYCFNVLRVLEDGNKANPDNQIPLVPELGVLTFCVIVLKNGFTVTGQSACADPNNYDADIGNRLAFNDAKNKIWAFMGYALKEEIYLNGDGTFKGRLEREERELSDKLSKLNAFYGTDTFKNLPFEERELMLQQQKHMADYHDVLKKRLA